MFKRFLHKYFHTAPDNSDVFLCIGTESLFFGVSQIYPPAAYVLVGLMFVGLAFIQARGGN